MEIVKIVICIIFAYLLGSISPAIRISKAYGIDIMKEGSGNAGSTNVLRVMGPKYAAMVFALDVLKGVIATLAPLFLVGDIAGYWASVAVLLGHCFPIFHKFKAGKGVAPGLGAMLAVDWRIGLIVLVVGLSLLFITKRMSVGSIYAAVVLPVATFFLHNPYFITSICVACLIIFMHRTNIVRLVKGEEKPLSFGGKNGKKEKV
ncbi:MAG: glycerol-3-phosphate 1-O-acyltransferase PlsY [Coriobacteriia bacterium]|nr:glycerol-3-phosphate 1-O-acyltransferase PlsY [Coriobacteriia bacterium]